MTRLLFLIMLGLAPIAMAQQETTAIPVRVAPLRDIAIIVERSVPATSVSLRTAEVASELSAQITEMPLAPGDLVQQGDIVAKLDCGDSELALKSASSQLGALKSRQTLARQQLSRLSKLQQNRNASEDQINQRQAELDIVTAELSTQSIAIKIAERQVNRCVIFAPFPGAVTKTRSQVGNYVVPGTPIISLVDIDRIELRASLLETQVQELKNSPPYFEFAGASWPVTVRTMFPLINEQTQTREIRFQFVEGKPAPGAIGRLRWTLNGITVPASFLVNRGGKNGLFVVDQKADTRAKFLPIAGAKTGQPSNLDIDGSIMVVTDGRFGLADGQEIIIE